jgi:two-component system, sensor histidine kinase and response regulator
MPLPSYLGAIAGVPHLPADEGLDGRPYDEPFWQADASKTRIAGGTGLGLTITRRHVEPLGGQIGVDSEVGAGTRFTVRLPF